MCQSIGGVTQKHAIKFLVQLAFGEKATEVFDAKDFETLVRLCLRQSWGPAFSHVSENADNFKIEKNSVKETIIQNCINGQDCIKNLLNMYCDYFQKDNKSDYLRDNEDKFKNRLHDCKETDSIKNPISIGHFQKLFNMTTKHLLTLYLLRNYIWDDCDPFEKFDEKDIKEFFKHADCPIDSKILDKVRAEKDLSPETKEKLPKKKWSKFDDINDYITVQEAISEIVRAGESNLFYDFKNW